MTVFCGTLRDFSGVPAFSGQATFECAALANLTAYSQRLDSDLLDLKAWKKAGTELAGKSVQQHSRTAGQQTGVLKPSPPLGLPSSPLCPCCFLLPQRVWDNFDAVITCPQTGP
jgi:hypothetical protein